MIILQRRVERPLAAIAFSFLLMLCVAVSWPALSGPFLFDDFPNLQKLGELQGRLDWRSLSHYMSLFEGEPGRPLSMLSFVINDASWPSEPWAFKFTNLMLHLLNGVLVFGLGRSLARQRIDSARADVAALLLMGAWLLHPMQLSTSMLVIQRMTQLAALFSFAGLWGYVALARRASRPSQAIAAIAALGCGTTLSILCKENGALTPLLALIINATLLRGHLVALPRPAQQLLRWGSLLPVLILVGAITTRWNALTGFGSRDFTMTERLLSQCRALIDYIYQILLPKLRGGGIYHDDFAVSRSLLEPATTLPTFLMVAGIVITAVMVCRRQPVFAFAALWFFCGHALESTVFPLELYFEHRNYLPMFGPLFALSLFVVEVPARWQRPALAAAALWIAFAAWLTYVQAPIWGNQGKLVTVWALEHPQSPRAVQQHADFVYREGATRQAAQILLGAYNRGVRGSDFPLQILLIACITQDESLGSHARTLVPNALRLGEYNNAVLATVSRLRIEIESGRCPKTLNAEGWLALTEVVLENPNYVKGSAQSYIHVERAYMFQHRRNLDSTMLEFEIAYAGRPTLPLSHLIAATLSSAGLYEEAIAWLEKGLSDAPGGMKQRLSGDTEKSRNMIRSIQTF